MWMFWVAFAVLLAWSTENFRFSRATLLRSVLLVAVVLPVYFGTEYVMG